MISYVLVFLISWMTSCMLIMRPTCMEHATQVGHKLIVLCQMQHGFDTALNSKAESPRGSISPGPEQSLMSMTALLRRVKLYRICNLQG